RRADRPPRARPAAPGRHERRLQPARQLVVTTSADWRTRLWRARDGGSLRELRWNQGPVLKATFSRDGTLLATAGADGSARIWNVATGERLLVLLAHANDVVDVAFSPDGTHLATASLDWARACGARTTATCSR